MFEVRFPASRGQKLLYGLDFRKLAGQILISTASEVLNASVGLCHEAGAICEAYKLSKKITASVYV
jgi:hypothetical protein